MALKCAANRACRSVCRIGTWVHRVHRVHHVFVNSPNCDKVGLDCFFPLIDYNLLPKIRSDVYNESENCHILLCFRVYSDKNN